MSTLSQSKPPATARYESIVEKQLARALSRIRLLDITAACLGFLILTSAYALVMSLLDLWMAGGSKSGGSLDGGLTPVVRQIAFSSFLFVVLVYFAIAAYLFL